MDLKLKCPSHEMDTFYFAKTAAVRRGVKPSELLRLPKQCSHGCDFSDCEIIKMLNLPFRVLRNDSDATLVLFYNPTRLEEVLNRSSRRKILDTKGYAKCACLHDYLNTLVSHFRCEQIPHEIGLFLGYPAMDVYGYMQTPERVMCTQRWKVYGNLALSRCLMNLHACAEYRAYEIMERETQRGAWIDAIASMDLNMLEYCRKKNLA